MTYQEIMSLRSAYNQGIRTKETRQACNLYIQLRNQQIEAGKHISDLSNKPIPPNLSYSEILRLRREYQKGIKNAETRNATRMYAQIHLGKLSKDTLLQD